MFVMAKLPSRVAGSGDRQKVFRYGVGRLISVSRGGPSRRNCDRQSGKELTWDQTEGGYWLGM